MSRLKLTLLALAAAVCALAPRPAAVAPDVTIPFDLVVKHIVVPVTVDGSKPLSFVLDTGDKYGLIDIDRAKALGVKLGQTVSVGGAGAQMMQGAMVAGSTFGLPQLPGFSQPIVIALPLGSLASKLGADFDGIIGADFISAFVVEIDYQSRTLTLHDKSTFAYTGPGTSVPVQLNPQGHPIIDGVVTPVGGEPVAGKFVLDAGSGGPLALYSPFVVAHQLPGADLKTIQALGGAGAGGEITGKIGRVASLAIGPYTLTRPTAMFSEDKIGAFASAAIAGNIGEPILSRFKLFLDYGHNRVIFDPTPAMADSFDRAYSGLVIETEGAGYRTFRITNILENSPATEAGLQKGDIITSIDARTAADLTLTQIFDLFEKVATYKVSIRRGDQAITVMLSPRRLV